MAPIATYNEFVACRETVKVLARRKLEVGLSLNDELEYQELRARVEKFEKDGRFPGHVNKTGNEYGY